MTTVRSKMHLVSITEHEHGGNTLRFETRYDDTIPEDQRFQKATPTGYIEMQIDNPSAYAMFEIGKDYYVDFNRHVDFKGS